MRCAFLLVSFFLPPNESFLLASMSLVVSQLGYNIIVYAHHMKKKRSEYSV